MQRIQFNYSLKNIGLPSHNQYRIRLIEKVESVVQRMRWKAHFYLSGESYAQNKNTFGLQSKKCAPIVNEIKGFEDDLVKMVKNINFKNHSDPFLNAVADDLDKVKASPNVMIFADKTRNIYEASPEHYKKLLTDNITKTYKTGSDNLTEDINAELKEITDHLSIGDRIETMASKNAFITLKDHKDNFDSNPKCRLINPAKSELGKVSKVILDNINSNIRSIINVNQWKNSQSVIEWFQTINNKSNHTFLSFDIVEFYPSITEDLLNRVITWAKSLTPISDEHIEIIKHARKSLLFNGDKTWTKRDNESLFDVTMGCYDGAEICELVGLFILNQLKEKFGKNVGLYRDDGLALLEGVSGRSADRARKDLHEVFKQLGLRITAEVNNHIVNFLDITLNLKDEKYSPYRKPNNEPLYIDSRSNHPPSIIKQLPKSVNKRISTLSSDQSSFDSSAPYYENALNRSHYNIKMQYSADQKNNLTSTKRKRQRNVIWFNPPYSKNVRTNVARNFLQLIDKHFPQTNALHKIFNRNSVKVSYSCMGNIKSAISSHNHQLLGKSTNTEETNNNNCNCQIKSECPLQGNCLTKNIVYKAEVTTTCNEDAKEYIGMTATTFKDRYRNHKSSINNERYATETELSKYVWKLKASGKSINIKWSILKRAAPRSAGAPRCNLCLTEKLCILDADKTKTLNKRSELFSKCFHRNKFNAGKFKRVQQNIKSKLKRVRQVKRARRTNTRQQTVREVAQANNELDQNSVA